VSVLDNPAWHALNGPQRDLGEVRGGAGRYRPDVSPFGGIDGSDRSWDDLAELVGTDGAVLFGVPGPVPDPWKVVGTIPCYQFVAGDLDEPRGIELVDLTPDDAGEMVELAKATNPGPFRPRTIEMGGYLGCRVDGRLVAMAGERMRPSGFGEVSAVCVLPEFRRRRLGAELTLRVAANVRARGDEAFLHVIKENESAVALYRAIGFVERRELDVVAVQRPT
jgi:ribosomal protein S18 acetylase RimI-like enzyme